MLGGPQEGLGAALPRGRPQECPGAAWHRRLCHWGCRVVSMARSDLGYDNRSVSLACPTPLLPPAVLMADGDVGGEGAIPSATSLSRTDGHFLLLAEVSHEVQTISA